MKFLEDFYFFELVYRANSNEKRGLYASCQNLKLLSLDFHELFTVDPPKPKIPFRIQILKSEEKNILKVRYKECTLTTEKPDNFVMLWDKTLLKINQITRTPEGVEIEGNPWKTKRSLFLYPTDSKYLYMWQLRNKPQNTRIQCNINHVEFKMIKLSMNLKAGGTMRVYTMPLLHHG